MKIKREIAVRDFYGSGEHIFKDELGVTADIRDCMHSNVTKEIFLFAMGKLNYEMVFFYTINETFYFIATMETPIQVLTLPRDKRLSRFIGWQCEPDAYEFGTVIATYESIPELWDKFRIDDKSLEEIIPDSYILRFC